MKNHCLVCFLTLLLIIMRVEQIKSVKTNLKEKETLTVHTELDDLIEYLARQTEKETRSANPSHSSSSLQSPSNALGNLIRKTQKGEDSGPNFIETSLNSSSMTNERGMGCESFNKCSGRGSCSNGACICDEGYDYFDCSVNVLSKKK